MRSPIGAVVSGISRIFDQTEPPVAFRPRGQQMAYPVTLTGSGGQEALMRRMEMNGTLFSIVDLFSTNVAAQDWCLYRKARSGRKEDRTPITTPHPAVTLWNKPNDFIKPRVFVQMLQQHKELVGEFWWVVVRNAINLPESLWVVPPHRMYPVPSARDGVAGYVYLGPNGERVPLGVNDVIRSWTPHPLDSGPAGRGFGVVQAILTSIDSARFSAEWNRNFFLNSAVPGGIIEVETNLDDKDFTRLQMQWGEAHQGISAAHRVGILEGGARWVDSTISQRDMQFIELDGVTRDQIREGFRVHKHMLGQSDDVNLANAKAADFTFAKRELVNRLDVVRDALNYDLLPMFGNTGHGTGQPDVEFDYESPVPEDEEAENAERASKTTAFKTLVDAGVEPEDAALVVGLPPMRMRTQPAPAPVPAPQPAPVGGEQ